MVKDFRDPPPSNGIPREERYRYPMPQGKQNLSRYERYSKEPSEPNWFEKLINTLCDRMSSS